MSLAICGLLNLANFSLSRYYTGTVIKKNIQKATHWCSIASKQNDANSLKILAQIFLETKNYVGVIQSYEREIELNPSSDSTIELAVLYLSHDDFPKDLDKGIWLLKKALDFDEIAATAMFALGACYYNGTGVERDASIAEEYFNQACTSGDEEIKIEVKNFRDKIKENESSGCFITTAVCSSLNKTDNCYELAMFRNFRDRWLIKQNDGGDLIAEYYNIAPEIVKRIDAFINAEDIYKALWAKYLKVCLSYLEQGNEKKCKDIYIRMVSDLRKDFL